MAGPGGVIRISSCSEVSPLLATLGYQLHGTCGPTASLEAAVSRRAFLTLDSGFPLSDLEQTLQGGKPFAYAYPSTKVPVLFKQSDWLSNDKNKKDDVIDVLLHNPRQARLYWALARIDANTRATLAQSPGLDNLVPLAPVLDYFGSHICIRSGKVAVPGGTASEAAWTTVVGASPNSPGEFVTRLLSKDQGWVAAYFDSLSRLNSSQQSYFVEPSRLPRFYEALRGKKAFPSPARPAFRMDPGLSLLVSQLWLEPNGQPHVPGDLATWKQILGRQGHSKLTSEWVGRAKHWNNPEQLIEAMFALSRDESKTAPLHIYLTLSEIDRRRSPEQRLSPQTARLLADKFFQFGDQYSIFSEFQALNDNSITRFLNAAEAINRIPDSGVRADATAICQAIVGLWEILARQGEIPSANVNSSWQRVVYPFAGVDSSAHLFDATQSSLGELFRGVTGKPQFSQDQIIALLAGPKQLSPEGQEVRGDLTNKIRSVLDAQRLISLDNLFALGNGLNQMAQGKPVAERLLLLTNELQEFELPKPLFSSGERREWANGLYTTPHIQFELQANLTSLIKSPGATNQLAAARGQVVPFLRDALVGLNYAYYEPPGAQMLINNPLFVRAHDFSGGTISLGDSSWQTPAVYGRGYAASGGAHLVGSLADLPYVLAQVEQNFIVPENVQSLIWEDLVPSLLASAVVPRWWQVSSNELHAVTLYQQLGEQILKAGSENEQLRPKIVAILSDRLLPKVSERVQAALQSGHPEMAVSQLSPSETFYLSVEFRRRYPQEESNVGKAWQELDVLTQRYPKEVSWEQLSEDFGVPHPALEQTWARELLKGKPFPTFMGTRAACWLSRGTPTICIGHAWRTKGVTRQSCLTC